MLLHEAWLDKLLDYKRYVTLLFDEIKVCETLVYDKHHVQVIGLVQLGEMNDELAQFEQIIVSMDILQLLNTYVLI